jgi:hypothetical protein
MVALTFTRTVMFAVRAIPSPLRRVLDAWAQRQALKRRQRRLGRQAGR